MQATATEGRTTATISAEVELMTVGQAARALKRSRWVIYRLIEDGLLRGYVLGPHATVVDAGDVERMAREGVPDRRRKADRERLAVAG